MLFCFVKTIDTFHRDYILEVARQELCKCEMYFVPLLNFKFWKKYDLNFCTVKLKEEGGRHP